MKEISYNNYIITLDNANNLLYINVLNELTFRQYNIELSIEDIFEINSRLFNINLLFNVLLDGLNKTNKNITINIKENIEKLVINIIYEQQYDPYEFSISIDTLQNEDINLDKVLCEYNLQKKTINELQTSLSDLQTKFDKLNNDCLTTNIFNRLGDNYCIIPSNDNKIRLDATELISWGNKPYLDLHSPPYLCVCDRSDDVLRYSGKTHNGIHHIDIAIYNNYVSDGTRHIPYINYENNCSLTWYNEDELQFINSLKNIKSIILTGNLIITNLSFLVECTTLEYLTLDNCYNLYDLSGLEKLTNLKKLSLPRCKKLKDLSVLKNMKNLESLNTSRSLADKYGNLRCHLPKLKMVNDD